MRKSLSSMLALAMLLGPVLSILCPAVGAAPGPYVQTVLSISGRGGVNNSDSEPNNDIMQATNVTGNVSFGGSIGYTNDQSDLYRVHLNDTTAPNRLNASLNFTSSNGNTKAVLTVLDPDQFRLDNVQVFAGTAPVNVSAAALYKGYYYIAVMWDLTNDKTATVKYVLNVSLVKITVTTDGNDRMADAKVLSNGYSVKDGLAKLTDVADFYKLHMVRTASKADVAFLMVIPGQSLDIVIELYNGTATFMRQINEGAAGYAEVIYMVAPATDTYYFRVWDNAGSGNYDIKVRAGTGYLDNDNDFTNATIVQVGTKMIRNVTSNYDPDDFFAINLTVGEEVTANLTVQGYNATLGIPVLNLWLYNTSSFVKNSTGNNLPSKTIWYEADTAGYYFIRVGASDMSFGSYELLVTVVSPPRILLHNQILTMNEDTTTVLDLRTLFQDPQGKPLTFGVTGNKSLNARIKGSNVTINGTSPHWYGSETLTFSATNTLGKTAYTDIKVVVNHVNHVPVPHQQSFQVEFDEDTTYKLTNTFMSTKFSDVDGDELNFAFRSNPNFNFSNTSDAIFIKPIKDWNGIAHLTLVATDPSGLNNTTGVTVKVVPEEDAPVLVMPIPDIKMLEDGATTINLSKYFKDPDGDVLTYEGYSEGGLGGIRHVVINITGSIATLTLASHWYGTENVTFVAKDPSNQTASGGAVVIVTHVNSPPGLNPTYWRIYTETWVVEDHTGNFDLSKLFMDPDGDALSFKVLRSGPNLNVTLNGNTLVVTPALYWFGVEKVNISAQDPAGLKTSVELPITVIHENHQPVLSNADLTPKNGDEKTSFKFTVTVKDVDGDDPVVSVVVDGKENRMVKVSGDIRTGAVYSYTTTLKGGSHGFSFKADDNQNTANSVATPLYGGKIDVQRPFDSSVYLFYAIIIIVLILLIILAWAAWNRAQRMREFDDSWDEEEEIPAEEE